VLHLVSLKGRADRVQEIVKFNPDIQNNNGKSSLDIAVEAGVREAVDFLKSGN
jgi:hypothetical protein